MTSGVKRKREKKEGKRRKGKCTILRRKGREMKKRKGIQSKK